MAKSTKAKSLTIVFVHGWSVTNLNTYGELPLRLRAEAEAQGLSVKIEEIFLGKYISFHDEVRLGDISRAFRTAVNEQLTGTDQFICITHSTGGPVIRDWWYRYYFTETPPARCPMTHLIMLAPANYGSALAQLGKGRLGRLKSWFNGIEPGQNVLDWLELGSREAWILNKDWIATGEKQISFTGVFPFVLTGQTIDRKLYDNLNAYTGETGSDGVVRVAAANLGGRYIKLQQPLPVRNSKGQIVSGDFSVEDFQEAVTTPLRVIAGKSHSGDSIGIMNSVSKKVGDDKSSETIKAILDCIKVNNKQDYNKLRAQFEEETDAVQKEEQLEIEDRLLFADRNFIHDRYSMVIFKVMDSEGHPVNDFDLLITAGEDNDPNHLPPGFFVDKQRNRVSPETITYFLNYDVMCGTEEAVVDPEGAVIRPPLVGIKSLGLEIKPRPDDGFVHYVPCRIKASKDLFEKALKPNSTTLIEICLQRMVHTEVFDVESLTGDTMPTKKQGDFSDIEPGDKFAD